MTGTSSSVLRNMTSDPETAECAWFGVSHLSVNKHSGVSFTQAGVSRNVAQQQKSVHVPGLISPAVIVFM